MNIIQTNRSNMMESVLSYLLLYGETIADPNGLTKSIQKLTELMEAIWVKDNEKNGATNGKTAKKRDSGSSLINQVLKIAAGLYLWAKRNNNFEVKHLTDFPKSEYVKLRDVEKINKAKAIYKSAHGIDLNFAKIKPEEIEKLNQLAEEHKQDIGDVSNGATKRIAAGQTLDQMIDEAMNLLNEEFDKYLLIYKQDKPEMYAGYKAARVIWDKGGGRQTNGNGADQAAEKTHAKV
ncbi:MAG TPA: hypothetical protein VMT35_19615, partial [Ignavibacteriaceae bacterium]|nr:hypothetical protein [Ignavibacteriaceae bacterium]